MYRLIATLCILFALHVNMENYSQKFVTYEDIKALTADSDKYLIEVRNKDELEATGEIPFSTNVPLPELKAALTGSAEAFKTAYGREKPEKSTELIFTCRSGRRALQAAGIAHELGYTNVWTYPGSWLEWAEKEGLKS